MKSTRGLTKTDDSTVRPCRCRFCSSGRENLCVDAAFTGWDVDGGYAQSMRERHDFVYRLPDGYDGVTQITRTELSANYQWSGEQNFSGIAIELYQRAP